MDMESLCAPYPSSGRRLAVHQIRDTQCFIAWHHSRHHARRRLVIGVVIVGRLIASKRLADHTLQQLQYREMCRSPLQSPAFFGLLTSAGLRHSGNTQQHHSTTRSTFVQSHSADSSDPASNLVEREKSLWRSSRCCTLNKTCLIC